MSPRKVLVRLAVVVLLGVDGPLANTWYVDASAAPPGNGTPGSPYASIQYAHDQATTHDSDTIFVAPGTYFENLVLSKRVTVQSAAGPELTTLRPLVAGPILTLNGPVDEMSSLTFEGFRITGVFGPPGTEAVRSYDGKLLQCIVSGTPGAGYVGFSTQYDGNVVDCTIAGHDIGIAQWNVGYTFLRNTILWNKVDDFRLYSGFIPFIEYCAMGNSPMGYGQTGNFQGNPDLCYAWTGDMHLLAGSPCIDAGDPALPNDADGSRGDIGYHAYDAAYSCSPFTEYCPGDGSGAACPCSNSGLAGRGCDPSATFQTGALVYASGATSPDTLVLHAFGEMPTALTIFLQGNATLGSGVPFGDGIRCAGGVLKRLYVKSASGGEADAPGVGDLSITARSAALGDPILAGERRYYQTYYRDANANFCPRPQGSTFNASSGVKVVW